VRASNGLRFPQEFLGYAGMSCHLGRKAMVLDQFLANIANGRAGVGFEFHEALGTYLLEPYED
jgi:hypothetical protein